MSERPELSADYSLRILWSLARWIEDTEGGEALDAGHRFEESYGAHSCMARGDASSKYHLCWYEGAGTRRGHETRIRFFPRELSSRRKSGMVVLACR
jgi:hypothetical protein